MDLDPDSFKTIIQRATSVDDEEDVTFGDLIKVPSPARKENTDSLELKVEGSKIGVKRARPEETFMPPPSLFAEPAEEDFDGENFSEVLSRTEKKQKAQSTSSNELGSVSIFATPMSIFEDLPAPPSLEAQRMGELFCSVMYNERFKEVSGVVRKGDPVELKLDEETSVWVVQNAKGQKVGVLDNEAWEVLLGLSDRGIEMESVMHVGNDGYFVDKLLVAKITLYANPRESDDLDRYLSTWEISKEMYKSARKAPKPSTVPTPAAIKWQSGQWVHDHVAILQNNQAYQAGIQGQNEDVKTIEEIETDLDKLFKSEDIDNLPRTSANYRIKTKLYDHQKQGLYWMARQEKRRTLKEAGSLLFWEKREDKEGNDVWYNKITKVVRKHAPEQARGGILADDMGLGKTLQIISLIASTARVKGVTVNKKDKKNPGTTLIVCPLSVVYEWQEQSKRHVVEAERFSVHLYHGPNRFRSKSDLKQFDLIITTYQILAQEYQDPMDEDRKYAKEIKAWTLECQKAVQENRKPPPKPERKPPEKKEKSSIYQVKFQRVVLDEAHIIRDRKTRQCRACIALKAERRWCITGTPFQNKVDDAFALLAFLKVEPFTGTQGHMWWTKLILQPLRNQDPKGMTQLQKILSSICLRRKKSDKLKLPPKKQIIKRIVLTERERKVYDALAMSGKKQVNLMNRQSILKHYAFVLEMLLRMRQACDDINLVPRRYHGGFQSKEMMDKADQIVNMWEYSLGEDPCWVCLNDVQEPCMAVCGHMYCTQCLVRRLENTGGMGIACLSCKKPILPGKVITKEVVDTMKERQREREQREHEKLLEEGSYRSTKLKVLLDSLKKIQSIDRGFKAVIFSQWTSMLDIVHKVLVDEGFQCVRIDGRMSSQNRRKAIESFGRDPNIKIFLISLKAGSVGLNLTAANTVFLLDPWWNPAAEDQAVDRIHRLGQTKPVNIIRFIAKNTVEEKIMDLQKSKREMMNDALTRFSRSRKQMQQDRLQAYLSLFK